MPRVVVKVFSNKVTAEIARQLLGENGIPAFVLADDAGGMRPELVATLGVRLIVDVKNAVRAKEILDEDRSEIFEDEEA